MNTPICKFYKPYFKSGCRYKDRCPFVHLNKTQYVKYCQLINEQNLPNYNAKIEYNKSLNLAKKRRFRESIEILKKLLIDYPLNEQIHELLAKCYCSSKLYQNEARKTFQKLISIYPYDPIHHNNYSMFLYRNYSNSAAKKHFLKSFELINNHESPSSAAKTHGLFAKYLFEVENDTQKSQHHYDVALRLNDKDAQCHYNYAVLLSEIGYLNHAEYHFKKSIATDGNNGAPFLWHHFQYALFLKKKIQKYDEAEKQFIKCCQLTVNSSIYQHILFEYGLFLVECLSNYDLGLRYLQKSCDNGYSQRYLRIYTYHKNVFETTQRPIQQTEEYDIYHIEANKDENTAETKEETKEERKEERKEENKEERKDNKNRSNIPSCSGEFRRFLEDKVFNNRIIASDYYAKFAADSLNDIRILALKEFDDEILKEFDIKIKIHRMMFMQQRRKFVNDCEAFGQWLGDINMKDEYEGILSGHGILTFESLYHYVNNSNDLLYIIGLQNQSDAECIWHSTPKMSRHSHKQ